MSGIAYPHPHSRDQLKNPNHGVLRSTRIVFIELPISSKLQLAPLISPSLLLLFYALLCLRWTQMLAGTAFAAAEATPAGSQVIMIRSESPCFVRTHL